jgi:hypothetical protein
MTLNERGNEIYRDVEADQKVGDPRPDRWASTEAFCERDEAGRYYYDFTLLTQAKGWKQFDTWQDAWYFGVWVNVAQRMTFCYAEGDRTLVICPTAESFRAELADAASFYGDPPPAAIGIDADGTVTNFYDPRPTGEEEGDPQ